MMTREQLHRMVVEIFCLLAISICTIFVINIFAEQKTDARIQQTYSDRFSDVLDASEYSLVSSDFLSQYKDIDSVYEGYDDEGNLVGYITEVSVPTSDGFTVHLVFGINSDRMEITGIKALNSDETDIHVSDEQLEILRNNLIGAQVPLALNSELASEDIVYSTVSPLRGLNDGIFYAQETEAGSDGYIDFVEIEVNNGIITRVNWDAFNTDMSDEYRSEASLTGAFNTSGEPWANQAYNLCHALINLQDPERLAMKSDKTTEIVDGVNCDISDFVKLSEECIMNSRADFDKDDYNNGLIQILGTIGISYETAGITDDNGHIIYSFGETSVFGDGHDTVGKVINPTLFTAIENEYSGDTSEDYFEEEIDSGYEVDEEAPFGGSVDGIPYSEIRTYLDGLSGDNETYNYVITGANTSYKFLKDYLNWVV